MIPLWKLKRELRRLKDQLVNLPVRLYEPILQRRYEATRWDKVRVHDGLQPLGPKVGIFLLYQPGTLAKSVIEAATYLSAHGYCVLFVANDGVTADSRDALLSHCWKLLERPNYGYDFGGYRDGVAFLAKEAIVPEHLIIMNDSIWYPLVPDSNTIARLEAAPSDATGLLLHTRARHEKLNLRRPEGGHIESYVIHVGRDMWRSTAFTGFWESYPLSNSKQLTIKRGEIGISKALWEGDHEVDALSRRRDFLLGIATKDTAFLRKTLEYAAYSDRDLQNERDQLMAEDPTPEWHDRALTHIEKTVHRRRFNASFCYATEEIFATSFVKKNTGMLFKQMRQQFVRAVEAGDIKCSNPHILSEIQAMSGREMTTSGA